MRPFLFTEFDMAAISPKTKLSELNIPYLQTVLEEVFICPRNTFEPEDKPKNIKQLAEIINESYSDVLSQLLTIRLLCEGIDLPMAKLLQFEADEYCVISADNDKWGEGMHDVSIDASWDRIFVNTYFMRFIVFVAKESSRAFSAAMALRQNGIMQAYYCKDELREGTAIFSGKVLPPHHLLL